MRGVTEDNSSQVINNNVEIIGHLTGDKLNEVLNSSDLIIARPGYSTLMDLAALEKKAILVPTPGQTEQEYLAKRLMDKGLFYYERQDDFDFQRALDNSKKYKGFSNINNNDLLSVEVVDLLSNI